MITDPVAKKQQKLLTVLGWEIQAQAANMAASCGVLLPGSQTPSHCFLSGGRGGDLSEVSSISTNSTHESPTLMTSAPLKSLTY